MNVDYILLIIFAVLMSLFLWKNKKKLDVQKFMFPLFYFVMYRTKIGLKAMDKLAAHKKFFNAFFSIGVVVSFLGMILICVELIKTTIDVLIKPTTPSAIMPVLPIEIKGVFYIPFTYWIISIFVIATIHEFCHGIASRIYKIPVLSSGFAFLGIVLPIVPAAFVEPDEKKVTKISLWKQLCIFSAGPFSNIVAAFAFLFIAMIVLNLASPVFFEKGIEIIKVEELGPSANILKEKDVIKRMNDVEILSHKEFVNQASKIKPGEKVKIETREKTLEVIVGDKEGKALFGITASSKPVVSKAFVEKYSQTPAKIFLWILNLLQLLVMLNLGIGLFNLLPIGPVDGGRMFKGVLNKYFPKKGNKVFTHVSLVFVALLLFHIIRAFI